MQKSKLPYISPVMFVFEELYSTHNFIEQQDASEYLLRLFQHLDVSVIKKIFEFNIRRTMTCKLCEKTSLAIESHNILPLPLNKTLGNLTNLFDKFYQIEHFTEENAYRCQHCQKIQAGKIQLSFETLPTVLIILLKRFRADGKNKLNYSIQYNEILDLKKYCSIPQDISSYQLYGIICHVGTSSNVGHYIAYYKDQLNDTWFKANDHQITKYDIKDILNKRRNNEYMLFYVSSLNKLNISKKKHIAGKGKKQLIFFYS
ncbi:unnamed protein product [Didymodactylos carnosus]|uniref:USP domain-containing protein n=1 Tax=Didymodactylos carnosus TaxID=1234261 RepID=A0A8S2G1L7_9BILA|nr:unnamed protein product [Didymodactylos carnosus]CAF4409449.1 unnamed protein product [Didymodactylos carnosus]